MPKRTSAKAISYREIYHGYHSGQGENDKESEYFLIVFLNEEGRKRFLWTESANLKKLGKIDETATHGVFDDDDSMFATSTLPAIKIDIPLRNGKFDKKIEPKINLYFDNLKKDKKIIQIYKKDVIDKDLKNKQKANSLQRNLIGQLLIRLGIGLVCTIGLGFVSISPLLLTIASIPFIAGVCYQPLAQLFFGQKTIELEKKNGRPVVKDKLEFKGLSFYFGLDKPYQKDLASLEKEIDSLLTQNGTVKDNKRVQVLTHQYAKKIVESNPSFFSEQDKVVVKRYALR